MANKVYDISYLNVMNERKLIGEKFATREIAWRNFLEKYSDKNYKDPIVVEVMEEGKNNA